MSKFFKLFKNNINRYPYYNNINEITFSNLDKKNPVAVNNETREFLIDGIKKLELENRIHNLKTFMTDFLEIQFIKFMTIGLPFVLSMSTAVTIGKFSYTKDEEFKRYNKKTIVFNEEGIIDEKKEENYILTGDKNVVIDPESDYKTFGSKDQVVVTFGNGETSSKVNIKINDNDEWEVYNYSLGNQYTNVDLSLSDEKQVPSELDENYKNIIKNASEIFIKTLKGKSNEEYISPFISTIENSLENDLNDILVELGNYEYVDSVSLPVEKHHGAILTVLGVLDFIYIVILIALISEGDFFKVCMAHHSDDKLVYEQIGNEYVYKNFNYLYTLKELKTEFIMAEMNRIQKINEYLQENNGSNEILSRYEKKLLKINDKKE